MQKFYTMSSVILRTNKLGFQWKVQDPFLFCAHHKDDYPNGNRSKGPASGVKGHYLGNDFDERLDWRMYHGKQVPGFPVHPHRGFETITIVLKGIIDHTDSAGGAGRYGNGDVQWMTAGTGLQHSEMFPLVNEDQPNPLELFQIWLNLPRSKKLVKPYYRMLWKEAIPRVNVADQGGKNTEVIIITGKASGVEVKSPSEDSWAADPENEVMILRVKMDPHASYSIPAAVNGVNRSLFFYKGDELKINGETLTGGYSADLVSDVNILIENGSQQSELLILQGKPINEPVVQYGPFVMNSQAEIQQTVSEYRRTEFGGWPWPDEEYVHADEPRFAKYTDGSIEYPHEKAGTANTNR